MSCLSFCSEGLRRKVGSVIRILSCICLLDKKIKMDGRGLYSKRLEVIF